MSRRLDIGALAAATAQPAPGHAPLGPPAPVAPSPRGPGRAGRPSPPRARSPQRALLVRLAACLALAVVGAHAWAGMVWPETQGRLVGAAFAGAGLGIVELLAGRLGRPARALLLAAATAAGALAALLLAGVPAELLRPRLWDDLAAGLGSGLWAMPGVSIPYRGVDEWNHVALLLGGTALAVAGPMLACWPAARGRTAGPLVPAVVLATLCAVPAVQLTAEHPYLDGLVFALLLGAVLFAERLAPRDAPAAVAVFAAAALAGLALAPGIDSEDPWLDYESFAQSIGERGTTAFSWDHSYGPLRWPRDGREVLRVRSSRSSYWKATTLTDFDGVRWREIVRRDNLEDDPAATSGDPRWVRDLRVTVRNLRTNHFVTAGTTQKIDRSPRKVVSGAEGSFVTGGGRPLRRGHAYLARVYEPRPARGQLEDAGSAYSTSMWPYLGMNLPESVGGPPAINPATGVPDPDGQPPSIIFSPWGEPPDVVGFRGLGYGESEARDWLERSAYARTYRLARRLRERSQTPYDFVRRVQGHLGRGYAYTESPPPARVPLDAFLFEDRIGYCQQFSGAMALLLRMGGVPTRVASGFTPGALDSDRGEYIVRDLDAHSWVEAYFPGLGWMTFDPTPAIAPARSQSTGIDTGGDGEDQGGRTGTSAGRRGIDPTVSAGSDSSAAGGGAPVALLVLAVAAGALLAALGILVAVGRRRRTRMGPEDWVRELERALRRSGRVPAPGMTLRRLEERLRAAPDAAAYVRALRAARYGQGGGPPTREQRAALRRELGAGLGLGGRLRALWALPPW